MSSVGVVVAAFNAEKWVARSLSSLRAQTVTAWQCVVVDDGSTDTTAAIVTGIAATDARISMIRQDNRGVAAARNLALCHFGPDVELVMLLDSDDLLLSDAMAVLTERLAARPDAVGVFGLAEYIDVHDEPVLVGVHSGCQRARRILRGLRFVSLPPGEDSTFTDMAIYGPIWPSAVGLHRRSAIEAVGGFDQTLRLLSDWDLYLRMCRRGPFAMVDRQVAWYRRHGANLTNVPVENAVAHAKVVSKGWLDTENTTSQRRLMSRCRWRLRVADTAMLGRTLVGAIRRGEWRKAGRASIAGILCATTLVRAKPPRPSRRRLAAVLAASQTRPD